MCWSDIFPQKVPTQISVCCGMLRHASNPLKTGPKNRCCGMLLHASTVGQGVSERGEGFIPKVNKASVNEQLPLRKSPAPVWFHYTPNGELTTVVLLPDGSGAGWGNGLGRSWPTYIHIKQFPTGRHCQGRSKSHWQALLQVDLPCQLRKCISNNWSTVHLSLWSYVSRNLAKFA